MGVAQKGDFVSKVKVTEQLVESPSDTSSIFCCALYHPINTEREIATQTVGICHLEKNRLFQRILADRLGLAVTVQHSDNIHYLGWYPVVLLVSALTILRRYCRMIFQSMKLA